tara:strand:+ start:165 stop:980 length:816 start_codon:yes stop_codon:yes gene_type:complete
MKHKTSYIYPKSLREIIDGKRHYVYGDEKLPSVTTILSATQSPEKTASLSAWRQRVGEDEATRIVDSAGARGTAMHKILEKYIVQEGYLDLTNVGKEAHNMATRVIEQGLCNVSEYYGVECNVFYPGLYAGSTDLVGVHKGDEAIIDFKQTNKPKKREWIEDYCLQMAAYAMAHNYNHKTSINKGVIMMCSKDNFYQEFVIQGEVMKKYMQQWLEKVGQHHELSPSDLMEIWEKYTKRTKQEQKNESVVSKETSGKEWVEGYKEWKKENKI